MCTCAQISICILLTFPQMQENLGERCMLPSCLQLLPLTFTVFVFQMKADMLVNTVHCLMNVICSPPRLSLLSLATSILSGIQSIPASNESFYFQTLDTLKGVNHFTVLFSFTHHLILQQSTGLALTWPSSSNKCKSTQ